MTIPGGTDRIIRVSGLALRDNRMHGKDAPVISIEGCRERARKIEILGSSTVEQVSPLVCVLRTAAAIEVVE